jgi:SecD/SecF fusion protein
MQNKGLIKLAAILFGLVSIYQLSFTFKANQIENNATQYAINKISESEVDFELRRNQLKDKYLDSLSENNPNIFDIMIAQFNYKEVNEAAMNLGLDLKGGINVILQISVKDLLKGLAEDSRDPIFIQALTNAEKTQKNSQNTYLEDFFDEFDKIKGDSIKLASPDIFANLSLIDDITSDMSDEDVRPIITDKIDKSIDSAKEVLGKRIDKFGVISPVIQRMGKSGRILVELPGAKDIERVKGLLQGTAQLEFWYTSNDNFINFLYQADDFVKKIDGKIESSSKVDGIIGNIIKADSISRPIFDAIAIAKNESGEPQQLIYPSGSGRIAAFYSKDKERITEYLNLPGVKNLLNDDQKYVKFLWGIPEINEENIEIVDLYAIAGNRDNKSPLSGSVIINAKDEIDRLNESKVTMQMNPTGSRIWEKMTGEVYKSGGQIAIVLDEIVYSAPGVSSGPISGGNSEISGNFSIEKAKDLANVLMAGKLPASADIIQADEVGPTLGKEAIDTGSKSFIIALILVLIWMIFYYGKAGLFSNFALILNIILIFGILSGMGAVLTLPGIAGIVLTIGIAVDANVLIYERIREEISKGKKNVIAVQDGFNNALSSILDANITTGLTALILYSLGTGPIKGFATTLLIGIITSLFTAIFITRILIEWYMGKSKSLYFSTGITKGLFKNMSIDFLKKTKITYFISASLIIAGLASIFTVGLDQGIDFVGGRTYTVRFAQDVNADEVREETKKFFNSPAEVKTIGSESQLRISTKYKFDESSAEVDEEVQEKLFNSLVKFLPKDYTYKQFLDAENNIGKMLYSRVSPTIADDIQKSSLWAVLASLVVVFLYILWRFKKWQFSLGAVSAVFHDVLIVLGIFSLTYKYMPFNMEIDQAFIAAILTVIGYSLNDTVVVFDRIREYIDEHSTWEFNKTINSALNSTLSRTLNTSFTTLVVLISIFYFGADSLRGLLFALIVGVLVGTYSSVFIATPIMRDTLKKYRD